VRSLHTEGLRNQVICCYEAQLLLPPKPSVATFVCFCCEPPLLLSLEGFLCKLWFFVARCQLTFAVCAILFVLRAGPTWPALAAQMGMVFSSCTLHRSLDRSWAAGSSRGIACTLLPHKTRYRWIDRGQQAALLQSPGCAQAAGCLLEASNSAEESVAQPVGPEHAPPTIVHLSSMRSSSRGESSRRAPAAEPDFVEPEHYAVSKSVQHYVATRRKIQKKGADKAVAVAAGSLKYVFSAEGLNLAKVGKRSGARGKRRGFSPGAAARHSQSARVHTFFPEFQVEPARFC